MQRNTLDKIIYFLESDDRFIALALGGSRARGTETILSDYDLFVIVRDNVFEDTRYEIDKVLVGKCGLVISVEMFYLENWGYLHKAIDESGFEYDISLISRKRISELGIKASNKILFDKDGLYSKSIECSSDNSQDDSKLEEREKSRIIDRCKINFFYCYKAYREKEYWEQIKYFDRIRRDIMLLIRDKHMVLRKHNFSPEKHFSSDINDLSLKNTYRIAPDTTETTFNFLISQFLDVVEVDQRKKLYSLLQIIGNSEHEKISDSCKIMKFETDEGATK